MSRQSWEVVPSAQPSERTPRQVARGFRRLLEDGARFHIAGSAKSDPECLLEWGYGPRAHFALFDTEFYLSGVRQNEDIRFFVAYVVQAGPRAGSRRVYPRILYKDVSLVWRSASHYIRSEGENWIGKGDVTTAKIDGQERVVSAEETTDLPFEVQGALEDICRRAKRIPYDDDAVALILRRAPDGRIWAYNDFLEPRRRAQARPQGRIHGGRPVLRFRRANDPTSLAVARGYEPDFDTGVLEQSELRSRLYGGKVVRHRIASTNRRIQYLVFSGPRHVWWGHPQATTTELMSYGVRTVDVVADEDLSLPGYEYHFLDESEDPPVFHSQIPEGFAGALSEVDPSRADASAWIDRVPLTREFRRRVLGRAGTTRRRHGQ